mmetsp:Transcript_30000/g.48471  ORF Transcript_30000/g.48471 Transcript_30000/m.48471 type:complete len:168 (-) Transcript_30000:210-713(-)
MLDANTQGCMNPPLPRGIISHDNELKALEYLRKVINDQQEATLKHSTLQDDEVALKQPGKTPRKILTAVQMRYNAKVIREGLLKQLDHMIANIPEQAVGTQHDGENDEATQEVEPDQMVYQDPDDPYHAESLEDGQPGEDEDDLSEGEDQGDEGHPVEEEIEEEAES